MHKILKGDKTESHCRLGVGGCAFLSRQHGGLAGGRRLGRHMCYPQLPLAAHHCRTADSHTRRLFICRLGDQVFISVLSWGLLLYSNLPELQSSRITLLVHMS